MIVFSVSFLIGYGCAKKGKAFIEKEGGKRTLKIRQNYGIQISTNLKVKEARENLFPLF